jgi:hypothetical protein
VGARSRRAGACAVLVGFLTSGAGSALLFLAGFLVFGIGAVVVGDRAHVRMWTSIVEARQRARAEEAARPGGE